MLGPERWTESYIRVPFVPLGFDKKGCHCWGLVCLVYQKELKVSLPRYDTITSRQVRKMLDAKDSEIAHGAWEQVNIQGDLMPFDVIIMRADDDDGKTSERHIGIYAGNGYILHVEENTDSKCERINSLGCRHRITRAFRYNK